MGDGGEREREIGERVVRLPDRGGERAVDEDE